MAAEEEWVDIDDWAVVLGNLYSQVGKSSLPGSLCAESCSGVQAALNVVGIKAKHHKEAHSSHIKDV